MSDFVPAVARRATYSTRCPFCHDALPRGGVQCGVCGARHHTACLEEDSRCATCGEDLADLRHRVLLREQPDAFWVRWSPGKRYHEWYQTRRQWVYRPLALLAVSGAIGLVLLIEAISRRF